MKKKHKTITLYLLLFWYLEFICKILMYNQTPDFRFIYVLLFVVPIVMICTILSKLLSPKKNKIIVTIFVTFITAFYIFNYMYYSLFSVPFSISTIELASQAMDFYEIGFHLVITKITEFLILLIPFILYFIYRKNFDYEKYRWKTIGIYILAGIFIYGGSLLLLNLDKEDLYSTYNLYYNLESPTNSTKTLGILKTEILDVKRHIFGFSAKLITNQENEVEEVEEEKKYNKLDINFDDLINNASDEEERSVYEYISSQNATNQNEYTGLYQGKNLIFILAEGFNEIAVDEERTPMLYKLIHEGFDFKNYYSPVFLSTTGGEFQAMTSLIPTQEILGYWRNNSPYLPYALGNSLGEIGYKVQSYHNWSYKYYGRDNTMPTLGFTDYTACGNGLEKSINCTWLPSDVDLINATFDFYKDKGPFATYYISVSGHAPYNFQGGNSIALKNQSVVEDLPYSDSVKAYLSTQMELEYALNTLISKLTEHNLLEDTVLVLTGDHYPYTLTSSEVNEISSYEKDDIVEVNHSNLIIWNTNNEHIEIEKTASQLDVLPTILNLFGIEYDSRLLLGKDIFSDSGGLAIFSDRSWVSDKGTYFASLGFVSKQEESVDEHYIAGINNKIANHFLISKSILKNNLYSKILGKE